MEKIYNLIKEDIRNHPEVKSSILGIINNWKRSQYVILADIISKNLSQNLNDERRITLGITISAITLQRFYENDYQTKTHNDLRFIKTLDKLCIFLGRNGVNDYIHQNYQHKNNPIKNEVPDPLTDEELVLKCCELMFEALKYLPELKMEDLSKTLYKGSPFLERAAQYLQDKINNNLMLVTENNRSNYEIFQITTVSEDSKLKVIQTQEFWNLVFKDDQENDFVVHHVNTQFYFLKKMEGQWRIWDNYNPDYGNILKK